MIRILFVGLSLVGVMSLAAVPGVQAPRVGAAPVPVMRSLVNPPPPTPISPPDGDTLRRLSPTLVVDGPVMLYHFRVMEGVSIAAEGYSLRPSWVVVGPGGRGLQRGHSYQWSCRVCDGTSWSEWFAPSRGFVVSSSVRPPTPKFPVAGAVVPSRWPVFVVAPAPVGVRYHFQVWNGKTLAGEGVSNIPMWRFEGGGGGLEPGILYSWTCRIEAVNDTSDWFSPEWRFTVADVHADPVVQAVQTEARPQTTVVSPEPFANRVSIFPSATLGRVERVSVFSADGRFVRELRPGSTMVWDGTDRQGRSVRPGTYICLLAGADRHEALKITKVE